jgi:hypothetical protein
MATITSIDSNTVCPAGNSGNEPVNAAIRNFVSQSTLLVHHLVTYANSRNQFLSETSQRNPYFAARVDIYGLTTRPSLFSKFGRRFGYRSIRTATETDCVKANESETRR